MLRLSGHAPSKEVEDLVRDLLREDANYDRVENRSSHREHLVLPIELKIRGGETTQGFSRNISAAGIGLITQNPINERAVGILKIERLKGLPSQILAECRWCRAYSKNWHISGWQFINVHQ